MDSYRRMVVYILQGIDLQSKLSFCWFDGANYDLVYFFLIDVDKNMSFWNDVTLIGYFINEYGRIVMLLFYESYATTIETISVAMI